MTPELRETLERWLKSDNEIERRHAQARLGQDLKYPSLLQQAQNAASAIGAVVAGAIRGEPVAVPQEEQDRRLAICHTCLPPEGYWDVTRERCSKCGCFGEWKTWLATQKCPIDKW